HRTNKAVLSFGIAQFHGCLSFNETEGQMIVGYARTSTIEMAVYLAVAAFRRVFPQSCLARCWSQFQLDRYRKYGSHELLLTVNALKGCYAHPWSGTSRMLDILAFRGDMVEFLPYLRADVRPIETHGVGNRFVTNDRFCQKIPKNRVVSSAST